MIPLACHILKLGLRAYGKGPRAVIWPPGHPHAPDAQAPSGKGMGTGTDPETRRLLRKLARRHMFKTMRVERRRRAIIMRENVARRTLIRANPQYGPFRPTDIYEDSQSEDEPTGSVAPAASGAPTAAAEPGYLPPPVIGRALDVLNAPGSTREGGVPSSLQFQELRSWRYGRCQPRTMGGTQTW